MSEWTVDTLKEHVLRLLDEKDRAIAAALSSAERANAKAEAATEKRFEGVNEFRAALADQQRTLMPRNEAEIRMSGTDTILAALQRRMAAVEGRSQGFTGGWGWAVGVFGLIALVVSLIMTLRR